MTRNILKALGIAVTLIGIVCFFAVVAPDASTAEGIETIDFEANQTSAVLENLIMTHSDSVSAFTDSYGECETN